MNRAKKAPTMTAGGRLTLDTGTESDFPHMPHEGATGRLRAALEAAEQARYELANARAAVILTACHEIIAGRLPVETLALSAYGRRIIGAELIEPAPVRHIFSTDVPHADWDGSRGLTA